MGAAIDKKQEELLKRITPTPLPLGLIDIKPTKEQLEAEQETYKKIATGLGSAKDTITGSFNNLLPSLLASQGIMTLDVANQMKEQEEQSKRLQNIVRDKAYSNPTTESPETSEEIRSLLTGGEPKKITFTNTNDIPTVSTLATVQDRNIPIPQSKTSNEILDSLKSEQPTLKDLGFWEKLGQGLKNVDWNDFSKKLRVFAAGANKAPGGDWGKALGYGNEALANYENQQEQRQDQKEAQEGQMQFKQQQYQNQLAQQQFQNQLSRDKFNLDRQDSQLNQQMKQAQLENLRNTPPQPIGNVTPSDFWNSVSQMDIPKFENDEQRVEYLNKLKEQNPDAYSVLQDAANYNQPIDYSKLNPATASKLRQQLTTFNPKYSPIQYDPVNNMRTAVTDPKSPDFQNLQNARTAMTHVETARNIVHELTNRFPEAINKPLNYLHNKLGPEGFAQYNNLKMAFEALTGEYSKYLIQGKPTLGTLKEFKSTLNENAPVSQILSALDNLQELLDARTLTIMNNYVGSTGEGFPASVLGAHIVEDLERRGWATYDENTGLVTPLKDTLSIPVHNKKGDFIDVRVIDKGAMNLGSLSYENYEG